MARSRDIVHCLAHEHPPRAVSRAEAAILITVAPQNLEYVVLTGVVRASLCSRMLLQV